MLAYLRGLTLPRRVLWCYLVWYLVVLVRFFDASPAVWLGKRSAPLRSGADPIVAADHGSTA